MAPKGKSGSNAPSKSKGEGDERDEPLAALVLADAFEERFAPFTLETARCLLPLANTPLLEYTLTWLANCGVEEVYVYSGNHTDQVEEYLEKSKWTKDTAPFSLELIRSDSTSVGDVMRSADQKGLFKSDFICVYGDVVANISLDAALREHRARREKSKNAIMTMVLRAAGDRNRTKDQHHRRCFVIDPQISRCIHYEQVRPHHSPRLNIPADVLKDHTEIDMREDLIDCGIDICAPDVLAQWSDSFDWKMPRKDFVHGVLQDYETFGRTIHTHVLHNGYAARANTLKAYNAVSKDVISRWAYPYMPDMNMLADQSFQLQKRMVYKEDGVVLARSSTVEKNSVLGRATSVGEGSFITNSVVGRRCVIGKRVKIDGAYIWDDVSIGDDTVINTAVIASEASVGRSAHIKQGALISFGARIGNGITMEENTRVTRHKRKRDYDEDNLVRGSTDPKVVGEDGEGFQLELDEDEEDVVEALLAGVQHMDLAAEEDDFSDIDADDDLESDYEPRTNSRSASFTSIASDESGETRRNKADFHHEATASIFDSLQKQEDPDTIQLELKALRMTSNAEDSQVRRAVAVAFNRRIVNLIEVGKSLKDAVSATIPPNARLIKACVKETDEQAEFMLYLQTDLVHRVQGSKILVFVANILAEKDMVDGAGLEQWWNDERSKASDELKVVRAETKQIVDIMAADSDDDDDDDDDKEDEEDD
jgi:translation initiation factor eIF-2B subunit epsilon